MYVFYIQFLNFNGFQQLCCDIVFLHAKHPFILSAEIYPSQSHTQILCYIACYNMCEYIVNIYMCVYFICNFWILTDSSGTGMHSLLHNACGVLHTFIQTHSVAWAPIISAVSYCINLVPTRIKNALKILPSMKEWKKWLYQMYKVPVCICAGY